MTDLSASDLARALAARRAIVQKTCVVCGRPFTALKKALYDSDACAQRAAYARHAEGRRAAARARYARQRQATQVEP